MTDEFILETRNTSFAPSANYQPPQATVDAELEESLKSIPGKMAFKIGEVAELVGVKPYVLRYWESEFEALKPKKSKQGQRAYSRNDVSTVMMIKKLLYRDKFSIAGARRALRSLKKDNKKTEVLRGAAAQMEHLRERLDHLVGDIQRLQHLFR